MAWSAPMTATSGGQFDASEFNTYVRDNFLQTLPALATSNTNASWFVVAAANSLVRREIKVSDVVSNENRSSTSYGDLTTSGPSVTVTTGTKALVIWGARVINATSNAGSAVTFDVSGATTRSADTVAGTDGGLLYFDGIAGNNFTKRSMHIVQDNLVAGSNTFTLKYKAYSGTSEFAYRHLIVWSF